MPKIVDHDERRERIVEIVAEMLATVGAERTTIREIARQSGYSRGFIEHYFKNKEELISKTIRWINERSLERVQEALDGKRGMAALRIFAESSLPVTPEIRNEWKIRLQFWGMAAVSEEHRREQSKRIHVAEKIIVQYLEEAQEMGEVEPDIDLLPLAHSLLHRLYGQGCNAILRPSYFTRQRQMRALDYIMEEFVKAR
ncbi:MAG: TetR family transcriptional regulator C-terminal domain-containing protein [Halioglobus sp.]|nr:TetR family transcriptional regulator C-terminal domain-containing protein [Halioglobus sp.]